jgi:hypothetical protein
MGARRQAPRNAWASRARSVPDGAVDRRVVRRLTDTAVREPHVIRLVRAAPELIPKLIGPPGQGRMALAQAAYGH